MSAEKSRYNTGAVPYRFIFGTYFRAVKRYPIATIFIYVCFGMGILISDVILKLYYRTIFDFVASTTPSLDLWPQLKGMVLIVTGLIVAYNAFWRTADVLIVWVEANVLRDLINHTTEKLQRHSYGFFIGNFTGSIVTKTRRFARAFETIMDKITFNFWMTGVSLLGILIVFALEMPFLAAFFGGWCVVYLSISYLFIRYRTRFDVKAAAADSAVTGELADIITNILNLKMFASDRREMGRFREATQREYIARRNAWLYNNTMYAAQAASMAVLEVIGMLIALRLWMQGEITTGTVMLVQAYFFSVMTHTWEIGRALGEVFKSLSDATEMSEILTLPLEVQDPAKPETPRIVKGTIEMRNMSFGYGRGKNVFSDFSLTIPHGQRVGIVGHSGAGKTTLFKLLLRFLDVTNGAILIDGQDIRAIMQNDLRSKISYVPQDPILFHRSLYENIAYAKPDATKEEVIAAAKRAHAHDFIENLSKGYDTLVGERGVKLSGGERQRVAIARVILKNAPILLLDEATSSLDSISEKYVQEQLKELMDSTTTLAIAHRISTIRQMDRIIVLDGGAILEDGGHDELLAKKGMYAKLWEHQSQGFLLTDDDEEAVTAAPQSAENDEG